MQKKYLFVLLGLFIAVFGALALFSQSLVPTIFDYILASRGPIAAFIAVHYLLSIILFFLIYIADNILMLPIASALTLFAGMFYSPLVATVMTLCAATLGSMVSFLLARYFIGKKLQRRYAKELVNFNELVGHYGTYYLVIVRFMPVIPFVLVNILAGLTLVRVKTFVLTTFFGLIPITLLLVFYGRELQHAVTLSDVFSGKMFFMGIILVLLTVLPLLTKRSRLML